MLNMKRHDRFLYWQREREQIRMKKEAKEPRPWTTDPTLNTYRFCNVRREDDKVTRWIHNHIRLPYADYPTLPVMLAIGRWFNEPSTLQYLIHSEGWPQRDFWSPDKFYISIRTFKGFGKKIYNPAYIISPCGNTDKEKFITETISWIWLNILTFPRSTMEAAFKWLNQFNGWGSFMSYQVIVDMRHTPLLQSAPDVATFAAFGPGTTRGLNRLHNRHIDVKPNKATMQGEVTELRVMNEIELEASDICNCLCEFDKYERVLNDEGKPKQLYR